jgi:hypothetical protein
MNETQRLENEMQELEDSLKRKRGQLDSVHRACPHQWGTIVYDPIVREGYHDPGDPPGTMGIDRRLPFDVPSQTTKQWKRTCGKCGKVEKTQRTKKVNQAGAIAGTSSKVEVPDFGN